MKSKRIQNSQNNIEKEQFLLYFKAYYKVIVIKMVGVRTNNSFQWKRIQSPEISAHICSQLILPRTLNGGKYGFQQMDGYSHANE